MLKAGRWYVVARRDGMLRTYRVDQIIDAWPYDAGFDTEPGFDLAAYWRPTWPASRTSSTPAGH